MATASGEPVYQFDIAVSFAGEDRELVEEVVGKLKNAGIRVFYDTDYQADMWGEDLVEYLDNIYRVKAHYTIIFISRFYAEKMWTSHERRSALARAVEQRGAYILPVRLDSTALGGLRPTIGYLDARMIGADGIVDTTLAKLVGSPPAKSVRITRVPRTEAERQQVILMRPPAWEFLYFAGQLLYERNSIEAKYKDHEIHYAPASREIIGKADITAFISQKLGEAESLAGKMTNLTNDAETTERAFGGSGEPGDPARIAHLAKRLNSCYEEFMDWAAQVRGVSAPSEFRTLLELLARWADSPVGQYRSFVDEVVVKVDMVPSAIAAGEPVRLELTLTLSISDEVKRAYDTEFRRVKKKF